MSALLGFGLATLFRAACKNRECIVFVAPSEEDTQDKTFKFNGKCYRFSTESIGCDKSRETVG